MIEPIAEAAAARIPGSPRVVSCRRMSSGFANANYRLETSGGIFLLRECTNRDRACVEYELDALDWLSSHQFPSPAAIRFDGGERWIAGPGDSFVVLLEWLDGSEPVPDDTVVRTIAHSLGDLHQLPLPTGDWQQRTNPNGREVVADLLRSIPPGSPELFQFFVRESERLVERLHEPLPFGFVHADLFADNTLFRGDQLVAILDFEAACEDALLFDVAMTIQGFCFPEERWRPDLAEAFLEAYAERRPLSDAEIELLPTYLQWCPFTLMGWHLRQLLRRPDWRNEKRATEHARRVTAMRNANWRPGH